MKSIYIKIAQKFLLFCFLLLVQQLSAQDTIKNIKHTVKKTYERKIFFNKSLDSKTSELTPYTDLNKLRLFNSPAVYYGTSYEMQGLSSSSDNCYVDGMLINDISLFPKSAIMNYNMFANFSPIEIGNFLSGFIDVQTLTPPEKSTFNINVFGDFTTNISFSMNQKGLYFIFNSPLSFRNQFIKTKIFSLQF